MSETAPNPEDQNLVARFESAMKELEELVARMESGDQPLEKALEDFERGVQLTRLCQQALDVAEQRVRILSEDNGDREQPKATTSADDDLPL